MELRITLIKYKEAFDDKYKFGICISSVKDFDSNYNFIHDKYFSLDLTAPKSINPFKYNDMFEVLFSDTEYFKMGGDS